MTPPKARGPLLFILASTLAAFLALAAACGGDGDDDDGDSEPTAERTDEPDSGDDEDDGGGGDDEGAETDEPTPDEGDGGGGGDDGGGDSGDEGIDVCVLLTTDEIEDALGESVNEGEAQNYDPFSSCYWSTESFNSVSVSVLTGDDASLEFYYELTDDAKNVEGIGDRAHWTDFGSLEVLVDGYDVDVAVYNTDISDDEALEVAKDLAEIVLERLP